jgi:hypothetical protein
MEINISIAGEGLNSKLAAKQLHLIADMVRAGVTEMDGFNIEYMGAFDVSVDFESNGSFDHMHHQDFWDGEGNHIHVGAEGTIISRQGPDLPDGTPDKEDMLEKGIKLSDWAKDHGGITPFGTPEEDLKDG